MLAINKRLQLVAEYVENRRLADIGSDHAYLPIYLAKNNKIDYAVAGEIVEGPHKVSIKNVREEGLVGTIDCRKAAGLDAIELSDNIEVITICGMGGKLIADILEKGKEKLANKPNLVLQPNVGENFVREKLQELGYEITAENIIEEDGHIYEIIVAKPGVMKLSEDEINFGKYLLIEKNELFVKKQKQELSKIEYILNQLEKGNDLVAESVNLSLLEDFDITFFYRLFWVFAKSGNPKIKPFDDFFMEMEEFPLDEVCPLMMEMLNTVLQTKKKQTHQKQQAKKPSR